MGQVARVEQFRAAAHSLESRCDCCGNDPAAERAEKLRDALTADPSFIGESIGNGDLTNLVEAFQTVDLQRCWDAVHDLVQHHLKAEESRAASALRAQLFSHQSEAAAVEYLAELHGIAA